MLHLSNPSTSLLFAQIAISAFFGVLFLQSGLDKVINFRENMSWLVQHFSKTFFAGMAPVMVVIIAITEMAAGIFSSYGVIELLIHKDSNMGFVGLSFSALSLLFLFAGQRVAKDYAGAASLVAYFIAAVFGLILLG